MTAGDIGRWTLRPAALTCALVLAGCATSSPETARETTASATSSLASASATPASDPPRLEGVEVLDLDAAGQTGAALVHGDTVRIDLAYELVSIDPVSGEVIHRVEPAVPIDLYMTPDGDAIWSSDFDNASVHRLDPVSGKRLQTVATGEGPTGVLVAAGSLWVANHLDGTVSRVDRASGRTAATITVGSSGRSGPQGLVADDRYLYVGIPNDNSVARIDMRTNRVTAKVPLPAEALACGAMATDGDAVWVTSCAERNTAARVDFAKETAVVTPDLGGPVGVGVVRGDVIWLTVDVDAGAQLVALDDSARVVARYSLPGGGIDGAAGNGALWLPISGGRLLRIPLSSLPSP